MCTIKSASLESQWWWGQNALEKIRATSTRPYKKQEAEGRGQGLLQAEVEGLRGRKSGKENTFFKSPSTMGLGRPVCFLCFFSF